MISAGRSARSDGDPASSRRTPSSSLKPDGSSSSNKAFDPQGSRRPPPSGAGPDDEAPQIIEGGPAATNKCPRLNEMLLVYLALLYASFICPPSVLSLAYFACALAATPICTYAAWIAPRARRGLCIGLACLSAAFLILQGSIVAVARVGGRPIGKGAQALIDLLAIEESGPVSFRLLSFITRDGAVLLAAMGALQLLRRTEEGQAWRRLTLSSPVRILPKASFLDCNWRMLTLGVLIVSSLVYPSLLSLPFYLAYLATLTAWTFDAFPLSSPAASERRLNSNRLVTSGTGTGTGGSSRNMRPLGTFGRGWERVLAASGAVYTGLYLLLIYLLQIPALATHVDAPVLRNYGAMSVIMSVQPPDSDRHLAVFSFHVIGVALIYCVAAAAVTSSSLERQRLKLQPFPARARRRTSAAGVTLSTLTPAGMGATGVGSSPSVGSLVEESEAEDDEEGGDEDEHHLLHQVIKEFAQWFVARYGLYLCFLVYIILALERPTILGFVFMLFVMVGAVLPGLVFRSCAPLLLVYTGCYAAAVYWFGAVGLRNGYFPPEVEGRLGAIGLVPMDPFTDGWLIAGVPLFMTTLLGFTWHYRKTDQQAPGVEGAGSPLPAAAAELEDDVVTKILGPVEWLTYLENYLVAHDIGLYLCLNIAFAVGVSFLDLPHFPFIALASLIIVVPKAAPYLWGLAVGYAQCFILYLYWEHYKHDSPTSFGQAMALPVVFFVFGCRQFAVYLSSWRRGKTGALCACCRPRRGRGRHGQGAAEQDNDSDRLALHNHGHSRGHGHHHQHHGHHRRRSALALQERPTSMRPTSRRVRATQAVNVSLYLAKIVLRLGLLGVMWHMAFHTPLTVFSLGYLALLATVPVAFILTTSFQKTSRHNFPQLFRAMSAYAGLVLCTLHIFCSQNLTGEAIDEFVGVGLQEHATTLILLNWVIQLLAASQTDILRQQAVSLEDQLEAYPLFVHALKQVLPFSLLAAIFGIAWEHLSLFGATVLYLGILNTALGRKVGAMWRVMVLLAIGLSLAIMIFDLQVFQRFSTSATLYWIGLRRGNFIPDPDAPRDAPLPPEAQGWLLSPSSEAYLIIAFLAALQFFYNTGADGEGSEGAAVAPAGAEAPEQQQLVAVPPASDRASGRKTVTFRFQETGPVEEDRQPQGQGAAASAAAASEQEGDAAAARLHAESNVSSASLLSEPPSPDIIDNTRAIAPGVTTLIEMLYNGKITDGEEEEEAGEGPLETPREQLAGVQSPDPLEAEGEGEGGSSPSTNPLELHTPSPESSSAAAATAPASAERPGSPSQQPGLRRASVTSGSKSLLRPRTVFGGIYHLLHRAVLTLLAWGVAFSYELCVVLTVTAALCHADLISFLYLGLFVLLVALPRATLRRHWRVLIHALALLVLAEYMFILRLPPTISYESQAAAKLLGSRQCSIFAQYTPPEARQGPYSYGQWFGLCITEDALVLLDFIVLVLAIIQHKRFKADKLRIERPLFAPLQFQRPNPLRRPEPDPSLDLTRYLVLQYGAYLTVIVIVILCTLTFNLLSLGYLLLIALMIQTHAQEGLLTKRRFMWTPLAAYAWICLVLRLLFQLPSWPTGDRTDAAPVLLGLRKVHASASGSPDFPPEMVFDGVILILIVLQRRVFLSPDFQHVVDELWYAEQYDYLAHGSHVVNQLEKIREDALAAIRTQIRTMYEQLETVARARMEEADNKSWEHFLLKNRGNAARDSSSGTSPAGGGSSTALASVEGPGDGAVAATAEEEERRPLLQQQSTQQQAPQQHAPALGAAAAAGPGPGEQEPLLLQHQPSYPSSASLDRPPSERRRRVSSVGAAALTGGAEQQQEFTGRTGMISFSLTHDNSMLGETATGGLRMTASYDDRTQTVRSAGTGTGEQLLSSSLRDRAPTSVGGAGGGGSTVGTPSTRGGRTRSMANETTALTQWVSDALKHSSLLEMKDPLEITDADVAAAAAQNRPTTPVIESATRRMTLFTPVFGSTELDAGEPPFVYPDEATERPLSTTSSSSLAPSIAAARKPGGSDAAGGSTDGATAPPTQAQAEVPAATAPPSQAAGVVEEQQEPQPTPASARARRGTKVGRFEQLVSQSFEEAKKRSAAPAGGAGKAGAVASWATRARQAGWRVARNVVKFMNSRSTSMVYTVLVVAHMYEPSLLNVVYPISVFGYALLQNPRSLPRIGGSLIHPMIQNPPRHFWHFLLGYSFLMLVIKFIYQFPFFCTCANRYSSGRQCPSALTAYKDVCAAEPYPHLDYYIDQPIVTDYFIGVFKAFKALSWNEMSVRYEPVNRYLPPDAPGHASETTLDSGLGGAFLVSFLGDVLVLLAVLWHTHVLKTRGVWLSRDPDFMSGAAGMAAAAATPRSGQASPTPSSHTGDSPLVGPASPGKQKKGKKSKARPLSWSPSLYRKRLASGAVPDIPPNVSPTALAAGAAAGVSLATGGGGGPTQPPVVPMTPVSEDEEMDGGEQQQGQQRRPSSLRSTTSADTEATPELVRGESIMTTSTTTSERKPPSCLARVFGPFLDNARAKPGSDLYVSLFFIQCLLFLFVLFAYQQADHLVQSVRENQLSGGFILVLLLHFILIVVDRIIYLHRSIRWKLILQGMLLLVIFGLIHSNFTFRIGINQHGPVFAWYCIMCAYLFVSALQISYGYPPFIQTNWMTKRAHHFWGNIFRLYRSLPFLYELRMLLDWACTPTTLYLGEWIKLEDIYCGLFIQECNLHFQQVENRRKGDRQPVRRKVLCGFLFFALLNLLVWLPLFIFSTGSLSQFDNYVSAGSLSVQLNGFPKLYEAASADYISPILPTETWSLLAQTNPALALLPATSTNDYMRELQFVRLPRSSQELWKISPPAEAELLGVLEGRSKQTTAAAVGEDGVTPVGPVEAASVGATAVEMTLRFSFGTQDGSINDGAVVHVLSGEEKRRMAEIIRGNRTALRLQGVLPSIIRISTTKEVTPLLTSGDILGDCVLTFTKLGDEVSTNTTTTAATNTTDPTAAATPPLTTTAVGWWDFTCGSVARGCSTALEPQGAAAAVVEEDPATGQPEPGCNPSIYTISSEKTIGSFFSLSYGIIGLYFTVVLAIGRFVHMSVMNKKYAIICDDLPRVEVLKELCETIYLARMYKNLALEEELYRELIDVYRRPQLIYQRTGPYRHWLREGDDGGVEQTSYYDQQVERELQRYR